MTNNPKSWEDTIPTTTPTPSNSWEDTIPASSLSKTAPSNWEDTIPESALASTKKEGATWAARSGLADNYVKEEEIQSTAKKYKVDAGILRNAALFHHAQVEAGDQRLTSNVFTDALKYDAGLANQWMAGVPSKRLYQTLYDTNTQKAIDEIQDIGDRHKSYVDKLMEFAAPVGAAKGAVGALGAAETAVTGGKWVQLAKELIKETPKAAGIGAAYGYGESRTGEELSSTLKGASIGAVLTPTAMLGTSAAVGGWHWLTGYGRVPAVLGDVVEKATKAMEKNSEQESSVVKTVMDVIRNPAKAEGVIEANPSLGQFIINNDSKYTRMKSGLENQGMTSREADLSISWSMVDAERLRLAKELESGVTGKNYKDVLAKHLVGAGTGEEQMEKIYQGLRIRNYLVAEAKIQAPQLVDSMSKLSMVEKIIGVQHVAADVDRRVGTTLELSIGHLCNELDLAGVSNHALSAQLSPLIKEIKSNRAFAGREGGQYLNAIADLSETDRARAVSLKMITQEESDMGQKLANTYKDLGGQFKEKGLAFSELKSKDGSPSYVPHMMVDPEEVQARAISAYNDLKPVLFTKTPNEIKKMGVEWKDSQDLLKILEIAKGGEIHNKEGILDAISLLKTGDKNTSMRVAAARATMERTGEIPELVREFDIEKTLNRYISNNNRNLALRDPIREIKEQIRILREAKDTSHADYFDQVVKDALGGHGREFAPEKAVEGWKNKQITKIVELEKQKRAILDTARAEFSAAGVADITKAVYEKHPELIDLEKQISTLYAKRDVPSLVNYLVRNSIATTLVGGKLKVGIRVLLQPFTLGMQEIGGTLGVEAVAKGYARAISEHTGPIAWNKELKLRGMAPERNQHQFTGLGEADTAVSGISKGVRKYYDKYAQAMYMPHVAADIVNRKVMLEAGKYMSEEYMKLVTARAAGEVSRASKELATGFQVEKYINTKLGPAYRTEIRRLERAGGLTQEKLEDLISNNVINKSQFRWTPATRSQYSRELGPLMTQFSRVPSEMLGIIHTAAHRDGMGPATARAVGPLLSLVAAQQLWSHLSEESELTPREKVFFYRGGLKEESHLYSLPMLIPGAGPELTTYEKLLKAFHDPEAFGKTFESVAKTINPLGAALNVWHDLQVMLDGEEPK